MLGETAFGYVGLFNQPYANKQYGTCMYAIGNAADAELCLVLLAPGNFMDAYTMASKPTWQNIHIFPSQLDPLFLSDVYRLVLELRRIKESVIIHFPCKPKFAEEFEYDDRFLFAFDTTPYFVMSDNRCYIEFTSDVSMDCLTSGILITNTTEKIHIVPYFNEEMIENGGLDLESLNPSYQLHVPYVPGYYGGMSWLDMYNSKKYTMDYIVPYCFNNWEEFESAKSKAKIIPKRWGANIRDRII